MTTHHLPASLTPDDDLAGLVLDARLHLLDRQVLDRDGVPVTALDDLELAGLVTGDRNPSGDQVVVITALVSGPALLTRIAGGRPPRARLERIRWDDVARVGTTIDLGVAGDSLDVTWFERWVRDQIIVRIPGGRHAPQ
ncbi:MAG TPA: hypothetical protein VIM76_08175 [Candidatus Dormibacteraeota bacterium]|jgi:hypothetical protein